MFDNNRIEFTYFSWQGLVKRVGFFAVFGGFLLLLYAIGNKWECKSLFQGKDFIPVDTVCIKSESRQMPVMGIGKEYENVYNNEFSYEVNGQKYSVIFYAESSDKIGETGLLYYNPDKPSIASPYRNESDWFYSTGMFLYIIAFAIIILGFICMYIPFIVKWKQERMIIKRNQEELLGHIGTVINDDFDL